MSADLRGFVYALEPLLRQRQWRVDAIQLRLGRVQHEIEDARRALEEHAALRRVAGEETARAFASAGDSHAHARRLQWLVALNERHLALEGGLSALQDRRSALQQDWVREQRVLEAVEAHRADRVQEHAQERAALAAAEADRDWLVRIASAGAAAAPRKGAVA